MFVPSSITLIRPDDWHVHVRDGAVLHAVLPYTARMFARAVVMPNLDPPIIHRQQAVAYRQRIMAALPVGMDFTPLMTLYLTDHTDVEDCKAGFLEGIYTAAKLYPAHATTHAAHGVTALRHIYPVLEVMQRLQMPLLIHGEVTDPAVDIFDREKLFLERVLPPLLQDFPGLKVVLEHITTADAVVFIRAMQGKHALGATITPHHLWINRNAMFRGGIRPHFYCLPVAKRESHRLALVEAALSGEAAFFLGTDSAPHRKTAKESACGCAGIFCAPTAMQLYAHVFAAHGALDRLEAFASINGAKFYGLPVNKARITLDLSSDFNGLADGAPIVLPDGDRIVPFTPHELLQ